MLVGVFLEDGNAAGKDITIVEDAGVAFGANILEGLAALDIFRLVLAYLQMLSTFEVVRSDISRSNPAAANAPFMSLAMINDESPRCLIRAVPDAADLFLDCSDFALGPVSAVERLMSQQCGELGSHEGAAIIFVFAGQLPWGIVRDNHVIFELVFVRRYERAFGTVVDSFLRVDIVRVLGKELGRRE